MNISRFFIALNFTLSITITCFSQPTSTFIATPTMPSPEAAALGKYGDIPVGNYTGVPSISIPLGGIKEGPLQQTISLSFHSSGIKVQEMASRVGIGWSLNTGGIITRTVQGRPDERARGYLIEQDFDIYQCTESGTYIADNDIIRVAQGVVDAEPDIFSFNIGNYSGKFYFRRDSTVEIIPKQDVKILPLFSGASSSNILNLEGFTVQSPDGVQYIFGGIDHTEITANSSTDNFPVISSWFLKKIETHDKSFVIDFEYEDENYSYRNKGIRNNHGGGDFTTSVIDGKRIKMISASTGRILFNYGDERKDLDRNENTMEYAQELESVDFLTSNGKYSYSYLFTTSYLQDNSIYRSNTSADYRLKLDQILKKAGDNSLETEIHRFEYKEVYKNGTSFYPNRFSKAVDHWGFYNGADFNNDYPGLNVPFFRGEVAIENDIPFSLPELYTIAPSATSPSKLLPFSRAGNADRESNEDAMLLMSLNRIEYPSKATANFEFEANRYTGDLTTYNLDTVSQASSFGGCIPSGIFLDQYVGSEFSFSNLDEFNNTKINFSTESCCNDGNCSITYELYDVSNGYPGLLISRTPTTPRNLYNEDWFGYNMNNFLADNYSQLEVGSNKKYRIKVSGVESKYNLLIVKENQVDKYNQDIIVGGLRIKKIITDPKTSPTIERNFSYLSIIDPSKSSGRLFNKPKYTFIGLSKRVPPNPEPVDWECDPIGFDATENATIRYVHSEASLFPLSSYNGYHISYNRVLEEIVGGGYIDHEFYLDESPYSEEYETITNPSIEGDNFPYPPSQPRIDDGKVQRLRYIDNTSSNVVMEKSFLLKNDTPADIYSTGETFLKAQIYGPWLFRSYYNIRNKVSRNSKESSIKDNVTQQIDYGYDPANRFYFPVSNSTVNSDGVVYSTENHFSIDYPIASIKDYFLSRNLINIPFKVVSKADGAEYSGTEIEYSYFFNNRSNSEIPYVSKLSVLKVDWLGENPSNSIWEIEELIEDIDPNYGLPTNISSPGWIHNHELTYTTGGNLSTTKFADYLTTYSYYPNSNLIQTITNYDGLVTTSEYDQYLRQSSLISNGTIEENKMKVDLTYSVADRKITIDSDYEAELTRKIEKQFDGLGRELTINSFKFVNDQKIQTSANIYDNIGRVKEAQILPNGAFVTYKYENSPLNRGKGEINPTGETSIEYSNQENYYKTTTFDEKMNPTITITDILGRVISTENALEGKTEYQYYPNGQVKKITTPELKEYTYQYVKNNLVYTKEIPGWSAPNIFTYTQDGRDLLYEHTDANGNLMRYSYDPFGRNTIQEKIQGPNSENGLLIHNFYDSYPTEVAGMYDLTGGSNILKGKLLATKSRVLNESGDFVYSANSYDQYGRVIKVHSTSPQNKDIVNTFQFNDADDLLSSGTFVPEVTTLTVNEFDTWGRILNSSSLVNNQLMEEYNSNYFPSGLLKSKNLGGLQSVDYHYNDRGWLRSINQDLGSFATTSQLPNCEETEYGPNPDAFQPVEPEMVSLTELLSRRFDLDITSTETNYGCEPRSCPDLICTPAQIAEQIADYETIVETQIEEYSDAILIPCVIDGQDTYTTDIVFSTEKLILPLTIYRVRLCNDALVYIFEENIGQLSGNFDIMQTIEIKSVDDRFTVMFQGGQQEVATMRFLDMIAGQQYSTVDVEDFIPCGENECTTVEYNCSNEEILSQQEALEQIKENYRALQLACISEVGGDKIESRYSSVSFPITLKEVALCDGNTLWVTQEEYDTYLTETSVNIVDEKIYESCDDEKPMSDVLTPLDKLDLFCLQLDYEPNGNIGAQYWQVVGRNVMKYKYQYDELNRIKEGLFAELGGPGNSMSQSEGNHFSVSEIVYSADGNIERLKRNGIKGYCSSGIPEFGPIDDLTYDYSDGDGSRLHKVSDLVLPLDGGDYGLPTLGNGSSYGYDGNGNMTLDPSRDVSIEYNYLNLPAKITFPDGRTVQYLYDASGVKWQKVLTSETATRTTDYLGNIELIDEEVVSVFLQEGRAAKVGDKFQMEYTLRDHLGNTRITFCDVDGDGKISRKKGDGEILQEQHYYPFGMGWENSVNSPWYRHPKVDENKDNNYQYNGKELQDEVIMTTDEDVEIQLGYYDYGARFYDPSIGRFLQVDPLADKMASWNPYVYVYNNPLKYTDPTGMAPFTDYLNTNGKVIGNDGNDNGKLVVVTDKKEARSIRKTDRAGGVTAEGDVKSGVALPSSFVRGEMSKAVDRAGSPSFHEEGGYFGTSNGEEYVVHAKPGAETDPSVDDKASINTSLAADISTLPTDPNATIDGTFHTHPDGTVKSGNTTYSYDNAPSNGVDAKGNPEGDIPNARENTRGVTGNHYVLAQGNKTVYMYNGTGTIAKIPFKTFFPKKK